MNQVARTIRDTRQQAHTWGLPYAVNRADEAADYRVMRQCAAIVAYERAQTRQEAYTARASFGMTVEQIAIDMMA